MEMREEDSLYIREGISALACGIYFEDYVVETPNL